MTPSATASAIPSVLPTYSRAPLNFVKGAGSWLTEADGRRFLDLGAGIAVNALGHAHPALVDALTEQAGKVWHLSNLYEIPQQQALADRLVEATFADTVFFTNSGTEACELAVKMVRKHWYDKGQPERVEIITFDGSFHGRSSAAIAAAGSERLCGLLDWCLRSVLPWFLEQLAVDYRDWARGQPRGRRKVNVTQVASEILAGGKGKLPPGVAESPVEASKISLDEA